MVIFQLAMVITFLMTIASTRMDVFRVAIFCLFHHHCPYGERTDELQKPQMPSPDGETTEMYIYTFSEKYLRYQPGDLKVEKELRKVKGAAAGMPWLSLPIFFDFSAQTYQRYKIFFLNLWHLILTP